VVANPPIVEAHDRLIARVSEEQDDVLCTLRQVHHDAALADRLFDQLVDLLVESMFLDLRREYLAGAYDRETYVAELGALAERCRSVGLLPLPARNA
jgi:hypothetical protein